MGVCVQMSAEPAESAKKIIILAGPTASGKSAMAYQCALKLNGTIINGDAMQLYQELPILTAQPLLTPDEEAHVPHHLYGVVSGKTRFSVAQWLERVKQQLMDDWQQGKLPFIVGGSGMYLRGLLSGLAEIPSPSHAMIQQAESIIAAQGTQALHDALAPEDKERLHPHDTARLMRSYAVYHSTGKALAQWQGETKQADFLRDVEILQFLLSPPRAQIYENCEKRFAEMLEQGVIDEVKNILHYPDNLPLCRVIGVQPIKAFLRGEIPYEEILPQAVKQTRNYAKRQYTWFRHQFHPDAILPEADAQAIFKLICKETLAR